MSDLSAAGTANTDKLANFCVDSFAKVCDQIWHSTSFRKHFDLPETPCAVHKETGFVVGRKGATPYDHYEHIALGQLEEDGKVIWLAKGTVSKKGVVVADVVKGQCHIAVGTKIKGFGLGSNS